VRRGRPSLVISRAEAPSDIVDSGRDAVSDAKEELLLRAGDILTQRKRGNQPPSREVASDFRALSQRLIEAKGAKAELDLLPGLWRLEYTTAPDVLSLFDLERLPLSPVRVGDIYQRYSATTPEGGSGERSGSVENIVKLSLPPFTVANDGLTFTVAARYYQGEEDVAIAFEKAGIDSIRLSPVAETLIAPAVVPRLAQLEVLSRIKSFGASIPLLAPSSIATAASRAAGRLKIIYVDDDLLLGEAFSGLFLFRKQPE